MTASSTPTMEPSPDIVVDVPEPGAVIAAFGSLWVQDRANGSVWRLDRHGDVVAKIPRAIRPMEPLGWESFTLAAGFGSVWTLADGEVVRIDPRTDRWDARITVPDYSYGLAVGEGAVWVACCAGGPAGAGVWPRLIRIDPETAIASVRSKQLTSPSSFAAGEGSIWWGNYSEAGAMQRIDPATGDDVRIEAANMRFIVPTPRWIWLISATGTTQRVGVGSVGPARDTGRKGSVAIGTTFADGIVWINAGDAVGFDADTGEISHRIELGRARWRSTGGIAVLGDRVWLADPARDRVVGAPIG
jgi:hypothetical protein